MVKVSRSLAYLGHLEENEVPKNESDEKTICELFVQILFWCFE